MNSSEIHKKYLNILGKRLDLENNINSFIERWNNGTTFITNNDAKQIVDKGYERLAKLKELEEQLRTEYLNKDKMEFAKKMANISVQYYLGEMPNNIEITGGILSNDASKSHLIGELKTKEQLESERIKLLNDLKSKVTNREISLAQASKLTKDVNTIYDFYESLLEDLPTKNEMHK